MVRLFLYGDEENASHAKRVLLLYGDEENVEKLLFAEKSFEGKPMSNSKDLKQKILLIYVIIEAILYFLYTVSDIFRLLNTSYIKYAGILICMMVAIIFARKKDEIFVACAMVFTVIADFFLLVIDQYYLIGISSFIVVQSLYFIRLIQRNDKTDREGTQKMKVLSVIRLTLIILLLIGLFLIKMADAVSVAAIFYFTNLFMNAVGALSMAKKDRRMRLFGLGLVLFMGCDICVGLSNLMSYQIALPQKIRTIVMLGMWTFYLPSQVLIVLSGIGMKNNQENASLATGSTNQFLTE